jgi:putative flippase GtrA
MRSLALRWLKFNAVGAIGIVVQLAALALFVSLLKMNYLAGTALAVEIAVLHNFVWHERFTWKDLPRGTWRDIAGRLLKFHAGNGAVSILGNLALMRLLVGAIHVNAYVASGLSIACCALLNFAVSEWFVFRRQPVSPGPTAAAAPRSPRES